MCSARSSLGPRGSAGKTTLVNYVLTAKHGFRVAVIVNEFGASAGIERAMLQPEVAARLRPSLTRSLEIQPHR